jgi:hypothetical protein
MWRKFGGAEKDYGKEDIGRKRVSYRTSRTGKPIPKGVGSK